MSKFYVKMLSPIEYRRCGSTKREQKLFSLHRSWGDKLSESDMVRSRVRHRLEDVAQGRSMTCSGRRVSEGLGKGWDQPRGKVGPKFHKLSSTKAKAWI
ncbi:Piso0_005370 [Millerozyma farinosa CBS 7064]|uniref:Piso0_005370 protein n=1 Tax=Pichia sorbitophila (strain ATCC MYA-4447 / BCRC 22081 / CBS 7064 / NBRC 10061 / NRRL Y-12695) TaxID=559304 RepID=G8Y200_PICSO|nr:Piso0_005370 [Millerozyma farinosa CBS 7064]